MAPSPVLRPSSPVPEAEKCNKCKARQGWEAVCVRVCVCACVYVYVHVAWVEVLVRGGVQVWPSLVKGPVPACASLVQARFMPRHNPGRWPQCPEYKVSAGSQSWVSGVAWAYRCGYGCIWQPPTVSLLPTMKKKKLRRI